MNTQDNLIISIIQAEICWEDVNKNIIKFEKTIMSLSPTNLIILPEMFTTGYTLNPEKIAESMDGQTVSWLVKMAVLKNSAILGSIVIKEAGNYFNRLICAMPDGKVSYYDKRHLHRMGGENEVYTHGNKKIIFEYHGWRILPLICYDLRFPVWSRNKNNYDLLIYVANWPVKRIDAWNKLLFARAIENQCFVVGVNRIGKDGREIDYDGQSVIIDPKGILITKLENIEMALTTTLHLNDVIKWKQDFPAYLDTDEFVIT